MNINIKNIALVALTSICITSCDDGDKIIDEILATTERGAVLRTIETFGTDFDRFDTSSPFGVTFEEQDVENGALLQTVEIFVNFVDNTAGNGETAPAEVSVATFSASDFTEGPFGLPRATYETTFADALAALGVVEGQFDGGDFIVFRLRLDLTDGNSYSSDTNTNTLTGSFFASPFEYQKTIKCIPPAPVSGNYTLDLADSFGDGWDGAKLTATIDGVVSEYTFTSGSEASFVVNVPDGTTEFFFTYISGSFEGEHSYVITAPTGETAIEDGPGPATGEVVLNICNG